MHNDSKEYLMSKHLFFITLISLAVGCDSSPQERIVIRETKEVAVLSPCSDGVTFDQYHFMTAADQRTPIYGMDVFATICNPVESKSLEFVFEAITMGQDNWGKIHDIAHRIEGETSMADNFRLVAPPGQMFTEISGHYAVCESFDNHCERIELDLKLSSEFEETPLEG
jgi:hypothetical protein